MYCKHGTTPPSAGRPEASHTHTSPIRPPFPRSHRGGVGAEEGAGGSYPLRSILSPSPQQRTFLDLEPGEGAGEGDGEDGEGAGEGEDEMD